VSAVQRVGSKKITILKSDKPVGRGKAASGPEKVFPMQRAAASASAQIELYSVCFVLGRVAHLAKAQTGSLHRIDRL
jgi:hypothetical protein